MTRTRVEISRDQRLHRELTDVELPGIVDEVLASEQEREIGVRRGLRVYRGGLDHLDVPARVLISQRLPSVRGEEFDAVLFTVRRREDYLRTEPSVEDPVRPRGSLLVRLAGIAGVLMTLALLQPLATLGVVVPAAMLLIFMGLCAAAELFQAPDPVPREVIDLWWSQWVVELRRLDGEVERARLRWRRTMAETHVRPLVREILEQALRKRSGLKDVIPPGLWPSPDSAYLARTKPVERFVRTTERVGAGAVGLAGARGSGKTLLIESYLDGRLSGSSAGPCLAVRVSAPVKYEPRDFVLHLYATLCHRVIALTDPDGFDQGERQWRGMKRRERIRWRLAETARKVVLLELAMLAVISVTSMVIGLKPGFSYWPLWVVAPLAAPVVLALSRRSQRLPELLKRMLRGRSRDSVEISALRRLADRRLAEIQFLQTLTSGWNPRLPLPSRLELGWARNVQRARQPLTYPEAVARFREFLEITARVLGGSPQAPRVLVGIDELDKIESAEQAQAFLNEIKSVFGVPGCQFLVAVSEDALAAFERRGIPIRDAFDSAFDRIVQVSHIDYADACQLLELRIPMMPRPFSALCHCLSGGVPRDLIRMAGAMVDLTMDRRDKEVTLGDMCVALVADELTAKAHAFRFDASQLGGEFDTGSFAWMLSNLPAEPTPERLLDLARDLVPQQDERTALTLLQDEAASFSYYCATLLEVFTNNTEDKLVSGELDHPDGSASFDSLAGVRQDLAVNPRLAWLALDTFRQEWGLPLVSRRRLG